MFKILIITLMVIASIAIGLAMAPPGICFGCKKTGQQCMSDFECGFGCTCAKLKPSNMYGICISDM